MSLQLRTARLLHQVPAILLYQFINSFFENIPLGNLLSEIQKLRKRLYRLWLASVIVWAGVMIFALVSYVLGWTSFQLSLELDILAPLVEGIFSVLIFAAWIIHPVIKIRRERRSATAS